jgi:hypothetical protein
LRNLSGAQAGAIASGLQSIAIVMIIFSIIQSQLLRRILPTPGWLDLLAYYFSEMTHTCRAVPSEMIVEVAVDIKSSFHEILNFR